MDESGSPTLGTLDPHYPIFVLAFLIVKKDDYATIISPAVQKFKFRYFGHEQVILHERDIRKEAGVFSFLKTPTLKEEFLTELTELISPLPFTLVCVVVRKDLLQSRYSHPSNPYHLGLKFGLERVRGFLLAQGEWGDISINPRVVNSQVQVIVEMRGKNEDNDLELEFLRICDGNNFDSGKMNFSLVFADKKSNSTGLQIADLVARPVGLSILKPEQSNRAFEAVSSKILASPSGYGKWGLKVFP